MDVKAGGKMPPKSKPRNQYQKIIHTKQSLLKLDEIGITQIGRNNKRIHLNWRDIDHIKWRFRNLVLIDRLGRTLTIRNVLSDLKVISQIAWYASKFSNLKTSKSLLRQSLPPFIVILLFISLALLSTLFFIFVTEAEGKEIWSIVLVCFSLFIPMSIFGLLTWIETAIITEKYIVLKGPIKKHKIAFKDISDIRITLKRFNRSVSPDIFIEYAGNRSVLALPSGSNLFEVYTKYMRAWDKTGAEHYPRDPKGKAPLPKSYRRFILFFAIWPLVLMLGIYLEKMPYKRVEKGTIVIMPKSGGRYYTIYEPGEQAPMGKTHYTIQTSALKTKCCNKAIINQKTYRLDYTIDYEIIYPLISIERYSLDGFRRNVGFGFNFLCPACLYEAIHQAKELPDLKNKENQTETDEWLYAMQKDLSEMELEMQRQKMEMIALRMGLKVKKIALTHVDGVGND